MGEEVVNLPLRVMIPKNQTEFDLGLMFRESLDQDTGMLFVFEENGRKIFSYEVYNNTFGCAFHK